MEQLEEFDYGIAEYIWKILKTQQVIVWSWGVDPDSVMTIKNGTQFHVQGFLMTGTVRIKPMMKQWIYLTWSFYLTIPQSLGKQSWAYTLTNSFLR